MTKWVVSCILPDWEDLKTTQQTGQIRWGNLLQDAVERLDLDHKQEAIELDRLGEWTNPFLARKCPEKVS
jgi:hypothetical protein